jgi:hypothetical protein
VQRLKVCAAHVHQDHVGQEAGAELTKAVAHAQHACAAAKGDVERFAQMHGFGVVGSIFLGESHEAQVLEYVERVVAHRPVGAEADGDSRCAQPGNRRQPRGKLHVGFRRVRDAQARRVGAHVLDIFGQDTAAVRDDRGDFEDARLLEHLNGRCAPLGKAGARLIHVFGGVDMDARAQFTRVARRGAQRGVVAGVGCVGRHPGSDAPLRRPLLARDEVGGARQRVFALAAEDRPA